MLRPNGIPRVGLVLVVAQTKQECTHFAMFLSPNHFCGGHVIACECLARPGPSNSSARLARRSVDPSIGLGLMVASLGHDIGHMGLSNVFLTELGSPAGAAESSGARARGESRGEWGRGEKMRGREGRGWVGGVKYGWRSFVMKGNSLFLLVGAHVWGQDVWF